MDTLSWDVTLSLGEHLRHLRTARRLSLAQAARLGQASKSALAHWEADRRLPSGSALATLLTAYEVTERSRARLLALADSHYARVTLAGAPEGGPVALGDVLRSMRLRRRMTQEELGRGIGRGQASVARWERGDDLPDASTLQSLLFALGATTEEITTVALLDPSHRTPGDLDERYYVISNAPHELGDVLWIGLHADLWWRGAESDAHDALLQAVLLHRADWYTYAGRYEETLPLARQAMRMPHGPPANKPHAGAYGVAWAAIRTHTNLETSAKLLTEWSERLRSSRDRAHVLSLRALVLAEMVKEPAHASAQQANTLSDDAETRHFTDIQLARIQVRHGKPQAAFETLRSKHDLDSLTIWSHAMVKSGERPPQRWVEAIRDWSSTRVPLYRERYRAIEEGLARMK